MANCNESRAAVEMNYWKSEMDEVAKELGYQIIKREELLNRYKEAKQHYSNAYNRVRIEVTSK